ncbi:Transcriptional regulator [Azospirillaceae bacterium]
METTMRMLVIEDEEKITNVVKQSLKCQGFAVDTAQSGDEARAALTSIRYDVAILDVHSPDADGLDILRDVRSRRDGSPIMIVAARDGDEDLTKHFALEDLVSRIAVLIRRTPPGAGLPLKVGNLEFDTETREVSVNGRPLVVPRRELSALELLMRRAGRVVTKESLESNIYANGEETESNALESHISRLRKRLNEAGAGVAIHGIRGIGYLFQPAEIHN